MLPNTTIPAMTTNRTATTTGCLSSRSPMWVCATNNDNTPKIMKTFHSSGTPIGIETRIPRWKHTIAMAATVRGQPPWQKKSGNGTNISMAVLRCASQRDSRPGRRSSGKLSKKRRFSQRGRTNGLLDIIVEMTNGKCLLSLDVAAPIQITRNTTLDPTIMSGAANRNVTAMVA